MIDRLLKPERVSLWRFKEYQRFCVTRHIVKQKLWSLQITGMSGRREHLSHWARHSLQLSSEAGISVSCESIPMVRCSAINTPGWIRECPFTVGCGCECGSQCVHWPQCPANPAPPPPNLCKSYQGSQPFPRLQTKSILLSRPEISFLPLVLGFFFCSNYGRMFSSFHQNNYLCICKRFAIPKIPFFKFHKFAPIFWPWLCPSSAAQNRRGELLVTEQWSSRVVDARALRDTKPTNQPDSETANQPNQPGPLVLQQ